MQRRAFLMAAMVLLGAACGDGAGGDTTGPPAGSTTTTTAAATTSAAPATTTTTAALAETTTTAAATTSTVGPEVRIVVTWDGEVCSYDGPDTVPAGTLVGVTYRNGGDAPSDLSIDFLGAEQTVEEAIAAWPDEYRLGDAPPEVTDPVVSFPEYPESVDAGGEITGTVTLNIPRQHIFICFGGGSSARVQTIDIATSSLLVTES